MEQQSTYSTLGLLFAAAREQSVETPIKLVLCSEREIHLDKLVGISCCLNTKNLLHQYFLTF